MSRAQPLSASASKSCVLGVDGHKLELRGATFLTIDDTRQTQELLQKSLNQCIALTKSGQWTGGIMTTGRVHVTMARAIGRPYGPLFHFIIAARGPTPPPH